MSEDPVIDKSAAIVGEKNEKISELESKLKQFEEKEAQMAAEAKAAEEKAIKDRLEAAEAKNKELEESFEKKLEQINMRASTAGNPNDKGSTKLTKEEYLANREKYDTMYLKATLPDVYN